MWSPPEFAQGTKDWLQALAWLATAVGAIVAAFKFRSELRLGRLQRERDLRWRQAEVGKSLNDEMQTDTRAWPALQMLDSERRDYLIADGHTTSVSREDVRRALDPTRYVQSEKDDFIRDCFDTLFYFMALMHHYIDTSLISEEDVAYPLEYYVPLLAKMHREVSAYLSEYNLWRTHAYLQRYDAWPESGRAIAGAIPAA
jgi:hypothetical protein